MKAYLALSLSIAFEVLATANVQLSAQFTRLGPTLTMAGAYLLALYFMSLAFYYFLLFVWFCLCL